MAPPENSRARTKPEEQSSSDDEQYDHRFRSRVDEYANKATWPSEPLYQVGEVVYLAIAGQQQPAGPFVVQSSDYTRGTYVIKWQHNGQKYPSNVYEKDLRVLG